MSGPALSDHVPALLTVKEVAELMRVHKDTVYDLISRGELQALDIGHGRAKTRISEDDYRSYIETRRVYR